MGRSLVCWSGLPRRRTPRLRKLHWPDCWRRSPGLF
jgi:hypothetical protein